jgi:hypothetical protein
VLELAFYCVCDSAHFLGLVALVNSLRLLGHNETVFVLDCGLEPWQRAVLAQDGAVAVVDAESSTHPMLLKAKLPLTHPARAMVVVDVDVIFTDRVDALAQAAVGCETPVLFPDLGYPERSEPAWERLGFGPPVPHPYVASGQCVLPAEGGRRFLVLWAEGMERLAADPTLASSGTTPEQNPFHFPDMDVLNALIGPAIPLDSFVLADVRAAAYPPFRSVRIVDASRLVVEYADGSRPLLLHHYGKKPWTRFVMPSAYSRLMTRLLSGADVALRVQRSRVPYRLRPGAVPRGYVVSRAWGHRNLRGKLGIRPRLERYLTARGPTAGRG